MFLKTGYPYLFRIVNWAIVGQSKFMLYSLGINVYVYHWRVTMRLLYKDWGVPELSSSFPLFRRGLWAVVGVVAWVVVGVVWQMHLVIQPLSPIFVSNGRPWHSPEQSLVIQPHWHVGQPWMSSAPSMNCFPSWVHCVWQEFLSNVGHWQVQTSHPSESVESGTRTLPDAWHCDWQLAESNGAHWHTHDEQHWPEQRLGVTTLPCFTHISVHVSNVSPGQLHWHVEQHWSWQRPGTICIPWMLHWLVHVSLLWQTHWHEYIHGHPVPLRKCSPFWPRAAHSTLHSVAVYSWQVSRSRKTQTTDCPL